VVLVKQFQSPKPYTGASSWKGYREYFERLVAVNGWTTVEQKVEQLALALEGPTIIIMWLIIVRSRPCHLLLLTDNCDELLIILP